MTFLTCLSFLALYLCVIEATTNVMGSDIEKLIREASQEVRTQENNNIKTASNDALSRETITDEERYCINGKIESANRDLNTALNNELVAVEAQYRSLSPEQQQQLDVNNLQQEFHLRFTSAASAAHDWVDQIKRCISKEDGTEIY